MSADDNKAIIRRWLEAWNAGTTSAVQAVDELLAEDYVRHDPSTPDVHGPAAEKQLVTMYLTAFPDLHFTIDALVADEDTVVGRFTAHGTQQGALLGIAPTGQPVTVSMMEMYRITGGKIAEQWVVMDALGMMQQLGVLPAPEQAGG